MPSLPRTSGSTPAARRAAAVLLGALALPVTGAGPAAVPSAAELIAALDLEEHVEGGYFRRSYAAEDQPRVSTDGGKRYSMTSIFYLLTSDSPIGHFHRNRSDIVHYFQLGDPIDYFLIHPDGHLEQVTLGPDPRQGQQLQLTVPGGIWKASQLRAGGTRGYGLISEAVSPGFDYADMSLGDTSELRAAFPQHANVIEALSRERSAR